MISTQRQKVIEKDAETDRKKAVIEAERRPKWPRSSMSRTSLRRRVLPQWRKSLTQFTLTRSTPRLMLSSIRFKSKQKQIVFCSHQSFWSSRRLKQSPQTIRSTLDLTSPTCSSPLQRGIRLTRAMLWRHHLLATRKRRRARTIRSLSFKMEMETNPLISLSQELIGHLRLDLVWTNS